MRERTSSSALNAMVFPAAENCCRKQVARRLEQHGKTALAGEQRIDIDDQESARLEALPGGGPIGAQIEDEPVALDMEISVRRNVDLPANAALLLDIEHAVEEVRPADETGARMAGAVLVPTRGQHLGPLAGEHDRGLLERRAALPAAHGAGVARRGLERLAAERGRYQERAVVDPGRAALGLGQEEAAIDEALGGEVELADHHGIGAAARQLHQAAPVRRRQRGAAMPHPILAFGPRQRVEIENDLPVGRAGAIARERGAAPEALGVLLVPPEIVEQAAALNDPGNAIGRVQDVEHRDPVLLEPGIAERIPGLGVAGLDPGARLRRVDLFQPSIRIVIRGGIDIRHRDVPLTLPSVYPGSRCSLISESYLPDAHDPDHRILFALRQASIKGEPPCLTAA